MSLVVPKDFNWNIQSISDNRQPGITIRGIITWQAVLKPKATAFAETQYVTNSSYMKLGKEQGKILVSRVEFHIGLPGSIT